MPKNKHPGGRPRISIDKDRFENLCALMMTEREIASRFGCSIDTINEWCKRTYGCTFEEIWSVKSASGTASLRTKMFELAMTGNTSMLIWLSKNYMGMCDDPRKYEKSADEEDTLGEMVRALGDIFRAGSVPPGGDPEDDDEEDSGDSDTEE